MQSCSFIIKRKLYDSQDERCSSVKKQLTTEHLADDEADALHLKSDTELLVIVALEVEAEVVLVVVAVVVSLLAVPFTKT